MSPFKDFEEKEQWIIFLASVLIGILLGVGSGFKGLSLISIGIGLICCAVGYTAALMHRKLSVLAKHIDLQIRKADKDTQQIAANLEFLIELSKQEGEKQTVRKNLNGIIQILSTKGLEDRRLRSLVLESLMRKEWKNAISVSAYGSPAEWMDPYWFSYLTLQIARSAELKSKGVTARRYFIYKKELIEEYREDLALLFEAHASYMEAFLYYAEDIEKDLRKEGIKLVDFTFIEYYNGSKMILWRNPDKQGKVEQITNLAEIKPIEDLMNFLKKRERFNVKGALK